MQLLLLEDHKNQGSQLISSAKHKNSETCSIEDICSIMKSSLINGLEFIRGLKVKRHRD